MYGRPDQSEYCYRMHPQSGLLFQKGYWLKSDQKLNLIWIFNKRIVGIILITFAFKI